MPLCVKTPKHVAEKMLKIIRSIGVFDKHYRVYRDDNYVYIPVILADKEQLISILEKYNAEITKCNPPSAKTVIMKKPPSYDKIGDVIVIREKVLETFQDKDELVSLLLMLHPNIKAIYVKKSTDGLYRASNLELLWGTVEKEIITKEYGLKFKVLLDKVYYNPRLSEEHNRIAQLVRNHEKIFDVFSGIGGFAIHIASNKKAIVFANDLNPYAYQLIIENIFLNKNRLKGTIIALRLDAKLIPSYFKNGCFDRVIANNPHYSLEFMDAYDYLLRPGGILHLYTVCRDCSEAIQRLSKKNLHWKFIECTRVLDYAPYVFIHRIDLAKPEN